MTTKPEHTRPFDLEHARAGAPFCCRDGDTFEPLKWDAPYHAAPIIGLKGHKCLISTLLSPSGKVVGNAESAGDLVMTPLAMISGKPVFCGDDLQHVNSKSVEVVRPHWVRDTDWSEWNWPTLANPYPKTNMTSPELSEHFDANLMFIVALENVANAALCHALDNGQIVTATEYNDLSDKLIDANRLIAQYDFEDPARRLIRSHQIAIGGFGTICGTKEAIEYVAQMLGQARPQADRDMAVAKAVRDATINEIDGHANKLNIRATVLDLDLTAIVAIAAKAEVKA